MSLFKNENPVLGPQTSETEVGLTSTSSSVTATNSYKPATRETISFPIPAIAASSGYAFQAPWQCQVVGIRFNGTVVSSGASALSVLRVTADAVAPAAANGTTLILLTAATIPLGSFTPNTRVNAALSAATGNPLILNAGDQIAFFCSATTAGLLGAYVQVEVVQIG